MPTSLLRFDAACVALQEWMSSRPEQCASTVPWAVQEMIVCDAAASRGVNRRCSRRELLFDSSVVLF